MIVNEAPSHSAHRHTARFRRAAGNPIAIQSRGSSANQVVSRGNDTSCSTPQKASPTPESDGLSSGAKKGIIAGVVVGVAVLIIGMAGTLFYVRRYKRHVLTSHAQEVDFDDKREGEDIDDIGEFQPVPYVSDGSAPPPSHMNARSHSHSASELQSPQVNSPTSPITPYARPSKYAQYSANSRTSTHQNTIYHSDAGSYHEDKDAEDHHIPPPYAERHHSSGTL